MRGNKRSVVMSCKCLTVVPLLTAFNFYASKAVLAAHRLDHLCLRLDVSAALGQAIPWCVPQRDFMSKSAPCILLQEVDSRGHSQRSTVAVTLDEDVTLHYGIGGEASKQYELRRVMFHHGNSSTNGHYTVAARQQHNGKCSQGDDWLYFDSAARPVTYTLPQLAAKFARSVTGVLLVAKANPLPEHHSEVKRSNPRCALPA